MVNQLRFQQPNSGKSNANNDPPIRGRSKNADAQQKSPKGSNSNDKDWDFFSPPEADTYVSWDFYFNLLGGSAFWKTLGIGMDSGEFLDALGIDE